MKTEIVLYILGILSFIVATIFFEIWLYIFSLFLMLHAGNIEMKNEIIEELKNGRR